MDDLNWMHIPAVCSIIMGWTMIGLQVRIEELKKIGTQDPGIENCPEITFLQGFQTKTRLKYSVDGCGPLWATISVNSPLCSDKCININIESCNDFLQGLALWACILFRLPMMWRTARFSVWSKLLILGARSSLALQVIGIRASPKSSAILSIIGLDPIVISDSKSSAAAGLGVHASAGNWCAPSHVSRCCYPHLCIHLHMYWYNLYCPPRNRTPMQKKV